MEDIKEGVGMLRRKDYFMIVIFLICILLMFYYPVAYDEMKNEYNLQKMYYYVLLVKPVLYISISYIVTLLIRRLIIKQLDYKPLLFNIIGIGVGGFWLFFTLVVVITTFLNVTNPVFSMIEQILIYRAPPDYVFLIVGISLNLSRVDLRKKVV